MRAHAQSTPDSTGGSTLRNKKAVGPAFVQSVTSHGALRVGLPLAEQIAFRELLPEESPMGYAGTSSGSEGNAHRECKALVRWTAPGLL